MKKTLFLALAVLGFALSTTAFVPAANAYTSLYQANQNEGNNN